MNDKELGFDALETADEEEIRRIAADCPASPEEKERMFKLSQKIYNERTNESNEAHAVEVSGVEQYKKPIWHKIVSAAAALALVAGLGTGGYFLARHKGADNHFAGGEECQVQEVTESNYTFGELNNGTEADSAEAEKIELPDFTAMNAELAKDQLKIRGLNCEVKKQSSSEVLPNYVIRTEPEAGTELKQGDTVILYVSMGSESENVTVDDYIGKMAEDASIMAGYKNFKVYTYEIPSNEPQGTVVEQYPAAGTEAVSGGNVTLFTSKGGYTAGEITYKFIVPEGINGRYSIDIIWTSSDGKELTEGAGAVIEPEVPVGFERFTGEGIGLKATAVITNLNNDKKAELGHYILDFDKGDYTVIDEDIEGAFEAIK